MKKKAYPKNGHLTLESMSYATWYNNWTIARFKKHLKGDILEVGCGIGSFTKILTSYGNVYAFDIDKTGVSKTKSAVLNAKVGFGDIEAGKYFFKNRKFDTITCINVLEHIKNDKEAINNMRKLLNNEGKIILLIPSHPILFGEIDRAIGHYRRYKKQDIVKLINKTGLEVVFARRMNFLGAIGWFTTGKIFKEVSVAEGKLKFFDKVAPFILPFEEMVEPPIGTSLLIIARRK